MDTSRIEEVKAPQHDGTPRSHLPVSPLLQREPLRPWTAVVDAMSCSISWRKALFSILASCFGAARTCFSRSSKKGAHPLAAEVIAQSNRWIVVQSFGTFLSVPHHVVSKNFRAMIQNQGDQSGISRLLVHESKQFLLSDPSRGSHFLRMRFHG